MDNIKEQKAFILDYLIDARNKLLSQGLEPVIDELLMDLDPEDKWHWNLMNIGEESKYVDELPSEVEYD